MNWKSQCCRAWVAVSLLLVVGCQDHPIPTASPDHTQLSVAPGRTAPPLGPPALSAVFDEVSAAVLALPQTVFGARDEAAGQLVFGVEHGGVALGVVNVLSRFGVPASGYRIEVTEPVRFLSGTLRTEHRPTVGGIQIHFGNYLCTLGFSVDHDGGRSFFTNSHCTDKQGETGNTVYYQPTSSANSTAIGTEAHDPPYFSGKGHPDCSNNKRCRYSDAARVLYAGGLESHGVIAKTDGVNNGSIAVAGSFNITAQDHTSTDFKGATLHKVGRTTGWTSGTVGDTCATVNVFGSNIQLLCQTFVHNNETTIVGSGDSGSPVFKLSGGNATLVGILWGGSGTSRYVFSPLSGLLADGLGVFNATTDGVGGADNGGGGNGGSGDGDDSCPPGHQRQGRC